METGRSPCDLPVTSFRGAGPTGRSAVRTDSDGLRDGHLGCLFKKLPHDRAQASTTTVIDPPSSEGRESTSLIL